jgi:hypothetical protein
MDAKYLDYTLGDRQAKADAGDRAGGGYLALYWMDTKSMARDGPKYVLQSKAMFPEPCDNTIDRGCLWQISHSAASFFAIWS